jgi:hypothetical protein
MPAILRSSRNDFRRDHPGQPPDRQRHASHARDVLSLLSLIPRRFPPGRRPDVPKPQRPQDARQPDATMFLPSPSLSIASDNRALHGAGCCRRCRMCRIG